MVFKKILEIISFKQNKWLEKYINFKTQKRNQAVNEFEKDFHKLLNNAFTAEQKKVDSIEKDDIERIIKQQSKLPSNAIHKFYTNDDS